MAILLLILQQKIILKNCKSTEKKLLTKMFGSRQRMTEAAMFTIGYGKIWHLAVLLIFVWSCQKSISFFIPSFFSAQDLGEKPIVSPKISESANYIQLWSVWFQNSGFIRTSLKRILNSKKSKHFKIHFTGLDKAMFWMQGKSIHGTMKLN